MEREKRKKLLKDKNMKERKIAKIDKKLMMINE